MQENPRQSRLGGTKGKVGGALPRESRNPSLKAWRRWLAHCPWGRQKPWPNRAVADIVSGAISPSTGSLLS